MNLDEETVQRIQNGFVRLDQGLYDTLDLAECLRCQMVLRERNAYDHLAWHDWLDGKVGHVAS